MTDIDKAIKIAVQGDYPPSGSPIDGHEFFIRSVKNKNMIKDNETSYFRHEHPGKDDRVFYAIGGPGPTTQKAYTAKLTRIQFRGPFTKNGFRDIGDRGISVTDAVAVLSLAAGLSGVPAAWIPFVIAVTELDAQGFLDGNWVPAAAKVADLIGKEMAQAGMITANTPAVGP